AGVARRSAEDSRDGGRRRRPPRARLRRHAALVSGASVVVDGVGKSFEGGRVSALREVSFSVEPGELVALTGPSGCGKSTLLNLVGALDRADSGSILVDGVPLEEVDDLVEYRAATVGF